MCFAGGEAFVEEMVGEGGVGFGCEFAEGFGEGNGFGGLRAGRAVGVEWVADDDDLHLVLADETGDGFQVGAQGGAVEGEEGLRGEAKLVGDGEADAFVADVERESAWSGHVCSVASNLRTHIWR